MGPTCCIFTLGDSKETKVGVSFWQDATKRAHVSEFYDNGNMDILESIIIQHSPMECALPTLPKYKAIRTVLERNNVLVNDMTLKKSELEKTETEILKTIPAQDRQGSL